MNEKKWESYNYFLSKCWLRFIVGYYIILLLGGILVSIIILANISGFVVNNILLYTCIVSMAVSVMLCSVQYLKRLYKACLYGRIQLVKPEEEVKQFGNIVYFVLRPIYAIVFVLITVFALLAGIIIVAPIDFKINERFLFLCVVIASIIGFSIGKIMDRFEILSSKQINNILNDSKEN
jgi:hypothetical protein